MIGLRLYLIQALSDLVDIECERCMIDHSGKP
jgi:hypothetical protein